MPVRRNPYDAPTQDEWGGYYEDQGYYEDPIADWGGFTQDGPPPEGAEPPPEPVYQDEYEGYVANDQGGFAPDPNLPDPNGPGPQPSPKPVGLQFGGFDSSKIGTGHSAKSPKYQFAEVAGGYEYDQGDKLLAELQKLYPDFWTGWEWGGKDVFTYKGDPNKLNPAWDGVDEIDFVSDFGNPDKGKSSYYWGVSTPQERAGQVRQQGGGFAFPNQAAPSYSAPAAAQTSYAPPIPTAPSVGSNEGSTVGTATSSTRPQFKDIKEVLAGLFPGGVFNQDVVNRRVDNQRSVLERERRQRNATNRAALAERGLIGSGPERVATESADYDLYDAFVRGTNDIYANESENADRRMIEAVALATGMTISEAEQAIKSTQVGNEYSLGAGNLALGNRRADIDRELGLGNLALGGRRADIEETLGLGNLGLGNLNAVNSYNLGLGNLGLQRDQMNQRYDQDTIDNYIDLLEIWLNNNGISRTGYR